MRTITKLLLPFFYYYGLSTSPWLGCRAWTFSMSSTLPSNSKTVWGKARIDYTAANEYYRAHYKGDHGDEGSYYFGVDSDRHATIYNARQGTWEYTSAPTQARRIPDDNDEASSRLVPAKLSSCGFELLLTNCRKSRNDGVTNWTNMTQIVDNYLPLIEKMLHDTYQTTSNTKIRRILFWNPILRFANATQTRTGHATPTASYAALPHIDTDVNAFPDAASLVRFIWKNRIPTASDASDDDDDDGDSVIMNDWIQAIESGHRFAIVNAWKNVDPHNTVQLAPLGMLRPYYDQRLSAFPDVRPCTRRSHWYVFPNMTSDEILLFCQYDRHAQQPSDVWHCAVSPRDREPTTTPRTSFDLRCLILFDEIVPTACDRFGSHRTRAQLDQAASTEFCHQQAVNRRQQKEVST